jgi:predicted RNA-binding Zn ribbon-like protein
MGPARSPIPTQPSEFACVELVNSAFTDHLGTGDPIDRLGMSDWQRWFLDRYSLRPEASGAAPVAELVALRSDLRRILDRWSTQDGITPRDVRLLDRRTKQADLRQRVRLADDGVELQLEPLQRDWTWVIAAVAASAVELLGTGDPQRLKTCSNPACSWMFYDTTVNRSRVFCSTTPCGSLMRVRRFRERV